ncbi:hypothetical protein OKA04_04710 [Luteolibacter flavescens]|uniref:Major tail protein n=1 Tax=Luteolibacter flavescens TaxID=1859460 RepID=A0ABT3FKA5_9BACT|nr:hypothetical protein [Luteolibacter flavescens]MCW1884018.1 hypothetical protein [Luteolibacter flavescens]
MASKFGLLAERITGASAYFVPDGSNIGTLMDPEITGPTAKPADDADWTDYNLGRITSAAYDPTTQERQREWFSPEKKKYVQRTDRQVLADAFNLTMVDFAGTLFDSLMFGLAEEIVAGASQPIFANNARYKDGWVRLKRENEIDKALITLAEFHVRLTIQTAPNDSSEPGSPVWRIEHLGDATAALETFVSGAEE